MYGAIAEFWMRERARLKHKADLEASCDCEHYMIWCGYPWKAAVPVICSELLTLYQLVEGVFFHLVEGIIVTSRKLL